MIANYMLIFIQAVTLKKLCNLFLINISYIISIITRKPFVWGYPPKIMIEPTNYCNLKCPLCPSGAGKLTREKGFMDIELYKRLIDQIKDHCFVIYLWNQGEPFLHKDIISIIKYARSKRIAVITSTNANVFPSSFDLVKSGLNYLVVSMDGTTQETYNKYRVNGLLDTVFSNIKDLAKVKKDMKESNPCIVCQFIVMKHNEHQINDFLAIEIGADKKMIKTVHIEASDDAHEYLPTISKYQRYYLTNDKFTLKKSLKNRCYRLWSQPVINWDGSISVCCFDKDNNYKIGNINHHPFKKLWKSKDFLAFRKTVLLKRFANKMCRNCDEGL